MTSFLFHINWGDSDSLTGCQEAQGRRMTSLPILGPLGDATVGAKPLKAAGHHSCHATLFHGSFLPPLSASHLCPPQVSWALGALSAGGAGTQLLEAQQGPPTGCPGRLLELKGMAGLGNQGVGGQRQSKSSLSALRDLGGSQLTRSPPQETSVCCVG